VTPGELVLAAIGALFIAARLFIRRK